MRQNTNAYAPKYQRARTQNATRTHSDRNAYALVRWFMRVTKSVRTLTRTHTCEQNGADLSSYKAVARAKWGEVKNSVVVLWMVEIMAHDTYGCEVQSHKV